MVMVLVSPSFFFENLENGFLWVVVPAEPWAILPLLSPFSSLSPMITMSEKLEDTLPINRSIQVILVPCDWLCLDYVQVQ